MTPEFTASTVAAVRHVESFDDGTRLAVYEEACRTARPSFSSTLARFPCLGDGVVPLLADKFRVIRYDNRGAGASSAPDSWTSYTMAHFADDFAAVCGSWKPGHPFTSWHGGVHQECGSNVTRPDAADRVASFTSVSGPLADHLGGSSAMASGGRTGQSCSVQALSPGAHLSYMGLFSTGAGAAAVRARRRSV